MNVLRIACIVLLLTDAVIYARMVGTAAALVWLTAALAVWRFMPDTSES